MQRSAKAGPTANGTAPPVASPVVEDYRYEQPPVEQGSDPVPEAVGPVLTTEGELNAQPRNWPPSSPVFSPSLLRPV